MLGEYGTLQGERKNSFMASLTCFRRVAVANGVIGCNHICIMYSYIQSCLFQPRVRLLLLFYLCRCLFEINVRHGGGKAVNTRACIAWRWCLCLRVECLTCVFRFVHITSSCCREYPRRLRWVQSTGQTDCTYLSWLLMLSTPSRCLYHLRRRRVTFFFLGGGGQMAIWKPPNPAQASNQPLTLIILFFKGKFFILSDKGA